LKRYFSVDCEFSGLNPFKYDLISIGIVEIKNINNKYVIDYNNKFYIELKPQHYIFEKEAMKINKLNFNNLIKYGSEPKEVIRQIEHFLNIQKNDILIFIGYCNVLDKIQVDKLYLNENVKIPFNYETIEISSLAMGKLNLEWGFSESDLEKLLKLKPMSKDKKHNSEEDALHQAEEFCLLMNK